MALLDEGSGSGVMAKPAPTTNAVTPITDGQGNILGYRVMVSEDEYEVLTPKQYQNLLEHGDPDYDPTGGGGGSTPTPYGYTAPDPLGAANALLRQLESQIDASEGRFNAEMAIADFEKQWAELGATQTRAKGTDIREREISEAQRRLGVAEEAGRRAQTVGRDYLPYMVPGATSMNLPLLGNMPLNQVNLGQVFSQGGVGDLSQLPAISAQPGVDYGLGPMPTLPQPWQIPQAPGGIEDLINRGAAGVGPMGFA